MRDFTHKIYKKFLTSLVENSYSTLRVEDYFLNDFDVKKPFIIIRHDVDRNPLRSLSMARLEAQMGIKATYYFRTIPSTLKPDIIQEIASLGHEIGYHYESLAEKKGNFEEAIVDFDRNLTILREFYPVKNIAMHGRPTSKYDSRDLWNRYDYKKYNILSEPYFDFDFNTILYITDAGRAWGDESVNLRDRVNSKLNIKISNTEDIIYHIKSTKDIDMMVNIHPEHWSEDNLEWYRIVLMRKIKNYIKKIFLKFM